MEQINIILRNRTSEYQNVSLFDFQGVDNSTNAGVSQSTAYTYDFTDELIVSNANGFSILFIIFQISAESEFFNFSLGDLAIPVISTINDVLTILNQSTFWQFRLLQGNIITTDSNYIFSTISLSEQIVGAQIPDGGGKFGTFIYQTNDIVNSPVAQIPTSNSWWINPTSNLIAGASNRNAVGWDAAFPPAFNPTLYQQCWNSIFSETGNKIVYIGITCKDCSCVVLLNNVEQFYIPASFVDNDSIIQNLANNGYNYDPLTSSPNDFFFILPLQLKIGYNLLQVLFGDGLISKEVAYQVYDNTPAQIAAATSDAELNILCSSKLYISNGGFFF